MIEHVDVLIIAFVLGGISTAFLLKQRVRLLPFFLLASASFFLPFFSGDAFLAYTEAKENKAFYQEHGVKDEYVLNGGVRVHLNHVAFPTSVSYGQIAWNAAGLTSMFSLLAVIVFGVKFVFRKRSTDRP